MVMFHAESPYVEAQRRGALRAEILRELTNPIGTSSQVDLAALLVGERL